MAAKEAALLVGTLFYARDVAHRAHLASRSYAQHMALGDFYSGIVDLADTFAEAWQGSNMALLDIPTVSHDENIEIVEMLAAQREWIRATRYSVVEKDETPLQNIIDEIEALYMSTVYKLTFLA